MNKSDNISTLAAALVKAQAKIGAAKKDSENPFFKSKYADFGQILEACKDALLEEGLTIVQLVGRDYLNTIILHESGEWIEDQMTLSINQQNNPQAVGSAITYARRYALQAALLIPTEDDDAESAMKPVREDQAIGERQERRENDAEKARNYSKGWRDAEEKLKEANRSLLEASEGQRRTPPPQKTVQANVELSNANSWQDVIVTYGKKDGPLRGKRMGDLEFSQLQFLYTMFGAKPLDQIDTKDRPMAQAINQWNALLEKEDEMPF
jgi:hypothetical protein